MPTLGDLKSRVISETDRDDLASGGESEARLVGSIERAIEHYSDERFWFNRGSGYRTTTNGVGYINLPDGVRVADQVTYNGVPLRKFGIGDVEHLTALGPPSAWAENGDNIQLSPIPDGAYQLYVYGIAQVDAPTLDASETIWTNEAYDLIAARTRFLLNRDVFRDTEGTQLAAQAEGEALSRLRRETRRRSVTPLRSPDFQRTTFNIITG